MYDLLRAFFMSLLQWASGVLPRRGEGVDAPVDHGVLRRAGSRIRDWMHSDGAGQRKQPNPDGAGGDGQGIRQDG